MLEAASTRNDTRTKIVEVAAGLLTQDGPAAVTTRGVAERAGVQAPTIYRLFGDKDGLLDAVAEHVLTTLVADKAATVAAAAADDVDPVEELRDGWQRQIDFGVGNPALFGLLSDPDRAQRSPAARSGLAVLASRVHRVALAGRLRVGEQRAVGLIQAAGVGSVLTLLSTPEPERDAGLAAAALDAVLAQILTDAPDRPTADPTAAAVAFRATVADLGSLSVGERQLLIEWLDRVISTG